MIKTVRIGIIGSGGIAHAHVSQYKKLPDVEIVAVADVVPGKAQQFIDSLSLENAQPFEDHRKLLELDLDGVSICTPNVSHHLTTVDALRAGKQVLLEKPMSVTLSEAVDMVQAARESGSMLTIGFQPRYDPNMKLVQDIV
ncbi:Gfo/Idh/MocA family oxidoreductase, partial [Paenibacillus sepulcri]|nr:Gfo/Idh/MocA family oxidoreductase [Paenibacillus sepulcri]